ncbi:MAG TPA: YkgJ family cysteine cluster protein [Polyangia bacterium]|jgi:hypothetical protein|nr:YkgJ family cysteine cluster protein [Polyangia bacterium]
MTAWGELDDIWLGAAARLGIAVHRGGEAYVHFDGRDLHIAADEALDADDSLAQLVMHELCHALVQGPANRRVPDWGLDNTHDGDHQHELACVRLQAHLAGAYGLREVMIPTTVVRSFYMELPADVFAPAEDVSVGLARQAALHAATPDLGLGPALREALVATVERLGRPRHRKSDFPLRGDGATCGGCVWRSAGGLCRAAPRRVLVRADEPACTRWEGGLDCMACGACCRSAYDSVTVSSRDLVRRRHPGLVVDRGHFLELARTGDHCVALEGTAGGRFSCRIYEDRPKTCRDFTAGGRHCLQARRRVGLSW